MIESFVQFAVKLVRANPLLKSTVGEFVRKANSYVLNIDNFEEFGSFEDSRGKSFTLRKGLRDYLKPDWRTLFDAEASTASLSRSALVARTRATTAAARNFEQLLTPFSDGFVGKTVLEIGCYDGASAFALSKSGCRKVVASDLAAYYIRQNPLPVEVQDQERHLGRLRSQVAEASKTPVDNVEFVFDDIISSSLPWMVGEVQVN